MEANHPTALTDQNFSSEVLQSETPVLVDFWASWCGPCRMIAPVIEELSGDYAGKAKICKLDVDAYGALAAQYGVMSIPTIMLFKDGAELSRFVGVQPKSTFTEALDRLLN